MFGNKSTKSMMVIHDDRAGEGGDLAFPNMSTCAAVICVLNDRLVGVHKTAGSISGRQKNLFDFAKEELIKGAQVHKLVIAGWSAKTGQNSSHSPTEIRNALGCQDAATYVFDYATTTLSGKNTHSGKKIKEPAFKTHTMGSKMKDLCTFVTHSGTGFPIVTVKRTTKVQNVNISMSTLMTQGHKHGSDMFRFASVTEDVTSSHDHPINQNKFTQVG